MRAFLNEQAHLAMSSGSFRRGLSAGRCVPADAPIWYRHVSICCVGSHMAADTTGCPSCSLVQV